MTIEVTERKRAGTAVRESLDLGGLQTRIFDITLSSISDFAYAFDREGRFIYANRGLLDLLGISQEEIRGKSFFELPYPRELAEHLQRQIEQVVKTKKSVRDETAFTDPSGRTGHYEYIFNPVLGDDGEVEVIAGSTRDLTSRKKTEEALRESEQRFRAMFEQASVGIVQIGANGEFVAANAGFSEFIGYTEEELKEMSVRDVTHPEDYPREEDLTRQLAAGEIAEYALEKRYRCKDGSISWGMMTATVVRQSSGEPLYTLAIVQAIGDRKRAVEQLRASEERFRQFADNSADVFWIVDVETQQLEYINPVFEQVWGQPREPLLHATAKWVESVHPDDRQRMLTVTPRALAGESPVVEYRIIRPSDGALRWIRETVFAIRDVDGRAVRVAGVAQDITEDKVRSEALRESEERFRLLVEGARTYAIFMLDQSNTIVHWNAGAERVFGWSAEEAVGQSGELIFTPEDRATEEEEKEIETALREGMASDCRWHLRKDGRRIWVEGVMARLDDDETGALRGFAKIARDASDERQSQQELERRVKERTAELTAINRRLETEMKQRSQLEQEILLISERERRRIGQDLHDSLCQELAATALVLQSNAQKAEKKSPAAAKAMSEAAKIVNANVGAARDLARGLHPIELGASGLTTALHELAFRSSVPKGVQCSFECPKPVRVRDEAVSLHLHRIAQEGVTNAIKNGKARNIVIRLLRRRMQLVLTVEDDGVGLSAAKKSKGMGIHIMKYRANTIGANLTLESREGRGTRLTCILSRP